MLLVRMTAKDKPKAHIWKSVSQHFDIFNYTEYQTCPIAKPNRYVTYATVQVLVFSWLNTHILINFPLLFQCCLIIVGL